MTATTTDRSSGQGQPAGAQTMTFSRAINSALRDALEEDPQVVLMGEDIGTLGGVFRITDGLQQQFGPERVIDTPLAESGIMGTAVGLAYRGYRPVVEIQFDGFVYPSFDQIVSQVAKLHFRTRGDVKMPITIRIPYGGGIGSPEHHSESPEAYFTHTAGLRVVSPSTPQDGYDLLREAIVEAAKAARGNNTNEGQDEAIGFAEDELPGGGSLGGPADNMPTSPQFGPH